MASSAAGASRLSNVSKKVHAEIRRVEESRSRLGSERKTKTDALRDCLGLAPDIHASHCATLHQCPNKTFTSCVCRASTRTTLAKQSSVCGPLEGKCLLLSKGLSRTSTPGSAKQSQAGLTNLNRLYARSSRRQLLQSVRSRNKGKGTQVPLARLPKRLERKERRKDQRTCAAHRAWVRRHQCCVPGCINRSIECANVRIGTDGGVAIKPSDRWAISLCHTHHKEQHQIGERAFQSRYPVDLYELALEFARRSPHLMKMVGEAEPRVSGTTSDSSCGTTQRKQPRRREC